MTLTDATRVVVLGFTALWVVLVLLSIFLGAGGASEPRDRDGG